MLKMISRILIFLLTLSLAMGIATAQEDNGRWTLYENLDRFAELRAPESWAFWDMGPNAPDAVILSIQNEDETASLLVGLDLMDEPLALDVVTEQIVNGYSDSVTVLEIVPTDMPAGPANCIEVIREFDTTTQRQKQCLLVTDTWLYIIQWSILEAPTNYLDDVQPIADRIFDTFRITSKIAEPWTIHEGNNLVVMSPEVWEQNEASGTIEVSITHPDDVALMTFQLSELSSEINLETFEGIIRNSFEEENAGELLDLQIVSLPIGDGWRAEAIVPVALSDGSVVDVHRYQYVIARGKNMILVTAGVGEEVFDDYEAEFRQIMDTLRMVGD